MIRVCMKVLLAGLVCFSLVGVAQARGKLTTTYEYYRVSGSTAASLHRNMTVPTGFFSSEKVYANITMKSSFSGKFHQGKTCRIRGFGINARFIVRLPKLSPKAKLSGRLKHQFSSFAAYVKKHELKHRSIWIGCLRSAERRINRLNFKSCNRLDSAAAAIIRNEWAKCDVRNARFDKLERKRLKRLSLVKSAFKPARQPHRLTRSAAKTRAGTSSALARSGFRRTLGKANN